jgi:hypothetical protein
LKEHTALSISFAAFLCTHRLVFLTNTSSYLHSSSCRPVLIHPNLPASQISALFHFTLLNLPVINSSELCIQLCRPLAPTWTGLPCARNSLLYRIHRRGWLYTPCFLRRRELALDRPPRRPGRLTMCRPSCSNRLTMLRPGRLLVYCLQPRPRLLRYVCTFFGVSIRF